jgi:hypothetical protein
LVPITFLLYQFSRLLFVACFTVVLLLTMTVKKESLLELTVVLLAELGAAGRVALNVSLCLKIPFLTSKAAIPHRAYFVISALNVNALKAAAAANLCLCACVCAYMTCQPAPNLVLAS